MSRTQTPFFPLFAVLLILVGSFVFYRALFLSQSDFEFLKPRAVIQQWQNGIVPNSMVWNKTKAQLESVQARLPNDPQVAEAQAYLHALQGARLKELEWFELHALKVKEALPYFERATRLRPMSPYAWGNIAFALHELDETDDPRFWDAYNRAVRYGRREQSVQNQIVGISLSRWKQLTPEQQHEVGKIVATMKGKRRMLAAQLAEREGIWGLVPEDEAPEKP